MLVLDSEDKSIVVVMADAVDTTAPVAVAAYADANGTLFTEGASEVVLDGTIEVELVGPPPTDFRRLVRTIIVTNIDVVSHEITISLKVDSTNYPIRVATLSPNQFCTIPIEKGPQGDKGDDGMGDVYTNTDPSVIAVGGIEEGMTFDGTTFGEFVDMMLYPELFGTLTNPSSGFSSTVTGFREIGEEIALIQLSSTFNRGSISPPYESDSPYRSGEATQHQYQYQGSDIKTDLATTHDVVDHMVISGGQTWRGRVHYAVGAQPKGSKGTAFSSPLDPGETSYNNRTITGVYPIFATTANITTMTKQALASMSSAYVQTNMVAESGSDKQVADFPVAWAVITGIQFFNTVSGAWEWIGGSRANSLLTFTTSTVSHTIQGTPVTYTRYAHNGSLIGARQLRWYTT